MQNETSVYEVPADQLLFTHEGLGEGQELGEAKVVCTIWGKARVRIVHKQARPSWLWLLAALAVLGALAAFWLLQQEQPSRETPSTAEPGALIEPLTPPLANTPAANTAAASTPAATSSVQSVPEPHAPSPAAETANPPPPVPQKVARQPAKPEPPAKQAPVDAAASAGKPKRPPVAKSPAGASAPALGGDQPEQPEKGARSGESPAPARPVAMQPAAQAAKATDATPKSPPPGNSADMPAAPLGQPAGQP